MEICFFILILDVVYNALSCLCYLYFFNFYTILLEFLRGEPYHT